MKKVTILALAILVIAGCSKTNDQKPYSVYGLKQTLNYTGTVKIAQWSELANIFPQGKTSIPWSGDASSRSGYSALDGGANPPNYKHKATFTGRQGWTTVIATVYYNVDANGNITDAIVNTSMITSPGIGTWKPDPNYNIYVQGSTVVFDVTGTYSVGISFTGSNIGLATAYDITGFFTIAGGGSNNPLSGTCFLNQAYN